jgi:hypothetical protein
VVKGDADTLAKAAGSACCTPAAEAGAAQPAGTACC